MLKISSILEILTEREREQFELVINKPKTPRLYFLFKQLNKGENDKAILFESLFGRPFSLKEDYLIRNELRLLVIRVNAFLVKNARRKAAIGLEKRRYNFEDSLVLLRVYLRRQAFSLFEYEWNRAEKLAKETQEWAVLFALTQIKAEYEQLRDELQPASFAKLWQLLEESKNYIAKAGEEQRAELDMLYALTNRYLRILGGEKAKAKIEKKLKKEAAESKTEAAANPVVAFFTAIAASHNAQTAAERLPIFLQAQSWQADVLQLRPTLITSFIALNNNIGLEYFLMRDFEQAAPYFDTALDLLDKQRGYTRAWDVRFNAYSNLLYWGKYHAAVTFHRTKPDFLAALPKRLYYRFHYLVAVAYLFGRDGGTALDLLNNLLLFQRPNTDYYYARLLFVCAYCSLENWESAGRELRNIAQAERNRDNPNEELEVLNTLLKQWVNFRQTPHNRQQRADFERVLHETAAAKINESPQNDSLPLRWLVYQLKPRG